MTETAAEAQVDASPLPGLEVAGTIVAVGDGVDAGRIGRRVVPATP